MADKSSRGELSFVVCFALSFVASALTTLAICKITPGEPLGTSLLNQVTGPDAGQPPSRMSASS